MFPLKMCLNQSSGPATRLSIGSWPSTAHHGGKQGLPDLGVSTGGIQESDQLGGAWKAESGAKLFVSETQEPQFN